MNAELVVCILFIITVFVISNFLCRYIYEYRLTDDSIEIILFNFLPIYKIPYSKITTIKECSLLESIFSFSLGNRIFGKLVLVEKNTGILRRIIFTPSNSVEFVNAILKRK